MISLKWMWSSRAKDIDSGDLCPGKSVLFYNSVLYIFYAGAESSWSCERAGFQEVLSFLCIVKPPSGKDRNNHHRLSCALFILSFINLSVCTCILHICICLMCLSRVLIRQKFNPNDLLIDTC